MTTWDRIIHICEHCGWSSGPLTREQDTDAGRPSYCDSCGRRANRFVEFKHSELDKALELADQIQREIEARKDGLHDHV